MWGSFGGGLVQGLGMACPSWPCVENWREGGGGGRFSILIKDTDEKISTPTMAEGGKFLLAIDNGIKGRKNEKDNPKEKKEAQR